MHYPALFIFTAAVVLLAQVMDMLVSAECVVDEFYDEIGGDASDKCDHEFGGEQPADDCRADCG